ncbi:protein trichome birefringence-like 23 [Iris pallida]|uniref:Protein trichome birefringence-like 23 n=1 Tax=Iris pallida TaxID=29817 RepID=A0AAX6FDZ5_IRIPA|nr:protein trichome birefringence-like 23 [Iris pallida]
MGFSAWELWHALQKKSNQIILKLLLSALLVGLSFRLFFFPTTPSSSTPFLAIPNAAEDSTVLESGTEQCDLFSGEWIPNPAGPAYSTTSCPFIEDPQNCLKNGRPDTGYLYWRWKPHDCYLPPIDANKFLQAMGNKTLALIGDSILNNHARSLLCLLAKVELGEEVYHGDYFKSRTWHFPSHNFTLSLIWSPFLVKADIFEDENGVSKSEIQLYLDTLNSKWTSAYPTFDYVVISAGQWFPKTAVYWENNTVIGCHYCSRKNLTEIGFPIAYGKVLQKVFSFVANSSHKPLILYRTWTPEHFENGEWWNGGSCKRTRPYRKGEYDGKDIDRMMYRVELEEFERARANGSEDSRHLRLLDTYPLSLLRPDGHSGPYRQFRPFDKDKNAMVRNDCLHWCLPGPVDTWNDILSEIVTNH